MSLYKVTGSDPEDLRIEINRLLENITNRLDQIEGYRGEPKVWNRQVSVGDLVVDGESNGNGVVLKDESDPPQYWRVTIDSTGTLSQTNLGREFK
jgi:hypothetical protein